jgi:hypothetical protein
LRRILPQARHDPIGVRYPIAAKPENVRRAGKLLGEGPPVLLGKSRILNGNAADGRHCKAQRNRMHSHVRSFLLGLVGVLVPVAPQASKEMGQREGSRRTKNCEVGFPACLLKRYPGRVENAKPGILRFPDAQLRI